MTSFLQYESFRANLLANLKGTFYRSQPDAEHTLTCLTEGCKQITAYAAEELLNNKRITFRSLIHPEDKERVLRQVCDLLKKKLPINLEYRIICKLGRIRWVHEIASGIYDENGTLLFVEGFISDVTAEKSTELISSALDSFQKAVNSASIVSITDRNGKIIYTNELFRKCSMYTQAELNGQDHRLINSGYHDKAFFQDLWDTILKGEVWRGEIRNKAKDGTYYWVDTIISPVLNKQGEIEQFLSIRNLITDKKNTEIALKESEAFSKGVLASLTSQIAVIDSDGIIYKANNAWKQDSGFLNASVFPSPVEGGNYLKLCEAAADNGNNYVAQALLGIKQVMSGKSPIFQMEYPCVMNGEERWFLLSASRFENGNTKVVLRNTDINNRKQTELLLAKTINELTEKNTELLQFNYIVSHNFRSPVATILGLCNLFALDSLSDADKLNILQNIHNSASKMDVMIKDLSAILSARSSITHKKEKISLAELIYRVKDTLLEEIIRSKADFNVEIQYNEIFTIKSYLESIILNLISNAIKYRSPKRQAQINVSFKKDEKDSYVLRVSDNGIGINLDKYGSQLFGLYKRFNMETEGKGLGLHMVKTQVTSLGGTITVDSAENKGAVFTVRLPAQLN